MTFVKTQVVGFGPAAQGLLIAADRLNLIDSVLSDVHFIDSRGADQITRDVGLNYNITSNSPANEFLNSISRSGIYRDIFEHQSAINILISKTGVIPLTLVSELLSIIAKKNIQLLTGNSSGRSLLFNTKVTSMVRNIDGTYTTYDDFGAPILTSDYVVLANGASQDKGFFHKLGQSFKDIDLGKKHLVQSDDFLSANGIDHVNEINQGEIKKICIFGGSHSAFSCLNYLFDRIKNIDSFDISVIHKSDIKEYKKLSVVEPFSEGAGNDHDGDDDQTQVNRFSGLRANALEIYREIKSGNYDVELVRLDSPEAERVLNDADVVINATGYITNVMKIHDTLTNSIIASPNDDQISVDNQCRVVDRNREILPNVYGIGLGYTRLTSAGVRRVGINLFHGQDAELIVTGINDSILQQEKVRYNESV